MIQIFIIVFIGNIYRKIISNSICLKIVNTIERIKLIKWNLLIELFIIPIIILWRLCNITWYMINILVIYKNSLNILYRFISRFSSRLTSHFLYLLALTPLFCPSVLSPSLSPMRRRHLSFHYPDISHPGIRNCYNLNNLF